MTLLHNKYSMLYLLLGLTLSSLAFAEKQPLIDTGLPDLKPDNDWQEIALPSNSIEQTTPTGRAWREPFSGCHLALFATSLQENTTKKAVWMGIRALLEEQHYIAQTTQPKKTDSFFTFRKDGITGQASLRFTSSLEAQLLTCFWSERDSHRCESACTQSITHFSTQAKSSTL